jgi:6-phosphogluconolactonase
MAYAVDIEACAMTPLGAKALLPATVQYACGARSGERLYVVSSDGGPGVAGTEHGLSSFAIDPLTKALHRIGDDITLRQRPIHVATDATFEHVLIAYNEPSAISVHRILPDGGVGDEVLQPANLDTGTFAHQIRVTPSNHRVIVVCRGNDAKANTGEEPGALKLYEYSGGVLSNASSIAPAGGFGFGPRNVDLDPLQNWIYVSLERQNKLMAFEFDGGAAAAEPTFECGTLDDPLTVRPMQRAGAVRVHPTGRFVYVANRAFGTIEDDGQRVFAGGENTIVVYEVDEATGELQRIQSTDTGGIYPRTFSIDPSGSVLIVGNSRTMLVREEAAVTLRSANLSVFAIDAHGRLEHKRTYEVDHDRGQLFWSGLV